VTRGRHRGAAAETAALPPLRLRRRPGDLLDGLNPAQREAASALDGPLLVLAGAGTGKTKCLIQRTALLVTCALVPPRQVMTVTFKTEAAREFRQRLASYLGDEIVGEMPWIGTFHALSLRLLRDRPDVAGLRARFNVADEAQSQRLVAESLKRLAAQVPSDPAGTDVGKSEARAGLRSALAAPARELVEAVASAIERMKGLGQLPDDVADFAAADRFHVGEGHFDEAVVSRLAFPLYQEILRETNAADFADLILFPTVAMRRDPALAQRWGSWFRAIQADEWQDTSELQFEWLRLLVGDRSRGHNLAVVGDDDQNMYSWRLATPENILGFHRHYPDTRVVRLEENYRNPVEVIEAGVALISRNEQRMSKRLRVADARIVDGRPPSQGKIPVLEFRNDDAEADYIAAEAAAAYAAGRTVAIIYRVNALSRAFEEALMKRGVPYDLRGTTSFWTRGTVQDVLAYARLYAAMPTAGELPETTNAGWQRLAGAFERVADRPARRLGEVTVRAILERARMSNVHPLVAAGTLADEDDLRSDTAQGVRDWLAAFARVGAAIPAGNLGTEGARAPGREPPATTTVLLSILAECGYAALIEGEAEDRDHALEVAHYAGRFADLRAFVAAVDHMLQRAAEVKLAADGRAVPVLSTGHSAKGLEFQCVFLPGWENGLFPHQKSVDAGGLEEERRIAFVKLTRTQLRAVVSHTRYRRGAMEPSPFLDELPDHVVERRTVRAAPRRQLDYAANIASRLGLGAPHGCDADAVSDFIRAHEHRFLAARADTAGMSAG
jgi:DNA helicase-2/ATP-dependent DNA helicase PcrA